MLIPEHYWDMDRQDLCGEMIMIMLFPKHRKDMNVATYHIPCIEIEGKTKTLYWMGLTNQTFKKEASLIVARIASQAFKSISRLMPNFAHLAFLP